MTAAVLRRSTPDMLSSSPHGSMISFEEVQKQRTPRTSHNPGTGLLTMLDTCTKKLQPIIQSELDKLEREINQILKGPSSSTDYECVKLLAVTYYNKNRQALKSKSINEVVMNITGFIIEEHFFQPTFRSLQNRISQAANSDEMLIRYCNISPYIKNQFIPQLAEVTAKQNVPTYKKALCPKIEQIVKAAVTSLHGAQERPSTDIFFSIFVSWWISPN